MAIRNPLKNQPVKGELLEPSGSRDLACRKMLTNQKLDFRKYALFQCISSTIRPTMLLKWSHFPKKKYFEQKQKKIATRNPLKKRPAKA